MLDLSVNTIHAHRNRVMAKLNIHKQSRFGPLCHQGGHSQTLAGHPGLPQYSLKNCLISPLLRLYRFVRHSGKMIYVSNHYPA